MAPDKESRICPYCGKVEPEVIGLCKVCGVAVCMNCGNKQITQTEGKIVFHNNCFRDNPSAVSNSFRFIKIVKS